MSNRILAAEDSPTQAAVLRGHLEGAGFEVSMASDGTEALAFLQEGAFDIVVSDSTTAARCDRVALRERWQERPIDGGMRNVVASGRSSLRA